MRGVRFFKMNHRVAGMAPYLWMLAGSACFAGMALLAKSVADDFSWPTIAAARAGGAFVLTLAWAMALRVRLVYFRPASLWMRSLAGTAAMLAGFYAISHSGGSGSMGRLAEVVTILNMYPLWVVALSWPLVGIPAKPSLWVGVLVGILGFAVISASDVSRLSAVSGLGDEAWSSVLRLDATFITAAFASLGSSIAMIGLHKTKSVPPLAIVVHFSCVATLIGLVAAWLLTAFDLVEPKPLPREVMPYVLLCAVGACATLGQVCLTMAFTRGSPGPVSAVGLMQAVFTALLEMVIYRRGFSPLAIAGIALVMAPTAWVMLQERLPPKLPEGS